MLANQGVEREIPNMHKHGKAGNGALKSKSQEEVRHHNKILTLNYLIEKKKKKPQKPEPHYPQFHFHRYYYLQAPDYYL